MNKLLISYLFVIVFVVGFSSCGENTNEPFVNTNHNMLGYWDYEAIIPHRITRVGIKGFGSQVEDTATIYFDFTYSMNKLISITKNDSVFKNFYYDEFDRLQRSTEIYYTENNYQFNDINQLEQISSTYHYGTFISEFKYKNMNLDSAKRHKFNYNSDNSISYINHQYGVRDGGEIIYFDYKYVYSYTNSKIYTVEKEDEGELLTNYIFNFSNDNLLQYLTKNYATSIKLFQFEYNDLLLSKTISKGDFSDYQQVITIEWENTSSNIFNIVNLEGMNFPTPIPDNNFALMNWINHFLK